MLAEKNKDKTGTKIEIVEFLFIVFLCFFLSQWKESTERRPSFKCCFLVDRNFPHLI